MKHVVTWALIMPLLVGCGSDTLPTKVVYGTVTVGEESPDVGRVRFLPVEGTKGPASLGVIEKGAYRIEARGGVPVGKHRVIVDAQKKTGRQVEGYDGLEMGMVDETIRLGPKEYASPNSPLIVEVLLDSDGQIDITIPGSSSAEGR